MIKQNKIVLKIATLSMTTVLLYLYLCVVFTPKSQNDVGGSNFYRGKGFMAEPIASDIIFFGDSSVYSGISPVKLYEDYGYTSYSSGIPNQNLTNVNSLLDKSIKTKKPKIAVLETNCFYTGIKLRSSSFDFILTPFNYHSRWKSLTIKDFISYSSLEDNVDNTKGYLLSKKIKTTTNQDTYMKRTSAKMKKENIKKIQRFINKCNANDITPVFMTVPNVASWNEKKHNEVQNLATKYDIPYIDFNYGSSRTSVGIDYNTDFRDNGSHLNLYGAEKVTNKIGEYLTDNFKDKIQNHQSDEKYSFWKDAVNDYVKAKNK